MPSSNHFKTSFNSLRVKKITPNLKQPDYYSIVTINKNHFTLTGWLEDTSSNIKYTLEIITKERLNNNSFLRRDYANFLNNK